MLLFDIQEYLDWRQRFIEDPYGHKIKSSRGECIVGPRIMIKDDVKPDWHLKNRDIEDAEFSLIYSGEIHNPAIIDRLYEDDDDLLKAYKTLKISSLGTSGKSMVSRNNIIVNKDCCLCYWQLYRNELLVVSRSLDIQRAGLSDVIVVNRIAHTLHCRLFTMFLLNNHIYNNNNNNNIARRFK